MYLSWFTIVLVGSSILSHHTSGGVIVDGDKKDALSPKKHQNHDEKSMIDPFNVKICGISDTNNVEHEFVNMAHEGQFPWIASFQIKLSDTRRAQTRGSKDRRLKRNEDLHFCAGSFVSDRWILSAAHCFTSDSISSYLKHDKLKVVAGSNKVSSHEPINRNLSIERIFYHDHFDTSVPIGFDIALVELKNRVNFSREMARNDLGHQSEPFINAVCLPLSGKKYEFNETARVAGWGLSNQEDPSSMPSKLLTIDVPLNYSSSCADQYASSLNSDRPKQQLKKFDDFICANYKQTRDACQSDSGGPLMQFVNGKAVVIGIVSYGIGCAKKGVPGLYTRASAYLSWIKDITERGKEATVGFKLIESNDNKQSTTTTEPPT